MPRTGISADSYGQWEQIANVWDNQLADSLRQVRQDAIQQSQLAQQARNDQLNMLSMAANLRRQRDVDAQNNAYRRMQLAASYGRRNDSDMLNWLKFAQEQKKDARTEQYYDYLKQRRAEEDNRKRLLTAQKDVSRLGMDAKTAAMSHGITDPQTLRELEAYANQASENWKNEYQDAQWLVGLLNEIPRLKERDSVGDPYYINKLSGRGWWDRILDSVGLGSNLKQTQATEAEASLQRLKALESLSDAVMRNPSKFNIRASVVQGANGANPSMTWEAIPPPNFTATVEAPPGKPSAPNPNQGIGYELPPGPKGRYQLLPDLTNNLWHYWDGEKWTYNVGESFVPKGLERVQ